MAEHLLEPGIGGQHGDFAAVGHQPLKDGPLDAEVDRHHAVGALWGRLQARIEGHPTGLVPLVGLLGGNLGRQVEAQHRRGPVHLLQQLQGRSAIAADDAVDCPALAQVAH